MALAGHKRKREHKHPYLEGNFAPVHQTLPLTPCSYTGAIPDDLVGGQYVRNGGNPVTNEDLGRDAHWFDGDGMLSGVLFRRGRDGEPEPEFVNQYILTDVYLSTLATPSLKSPILPSIATLVNPLSSLLYICLRVFRTLLLVLLSHLPGSKQAIKKISVANTAILYHDGRALATCESGPPMRIALPGLETVGWYDGNRAEGEPASSTSEETGFGGEGILSFMKEWTTAHPKVDPVTSEMLLFHSTFAPPYIHYSIIPATQNLSPTSPNPTKLLNAPVPGVSSAKMMHDFGVSLTHTVIMDLPLSLDPLNLAKNKPVVAYDSSKPSRFGVFPRREPNNVSWYETDACCIFHTANTWDTVDETGNVTSVNLLACRLTSASLVFSAGNIAAPQPTKRTADAVTKAMPFFERYDDDDAGTENDHTSTHTGSAWEKAPLLESPYIERPSFLGRTSSTTGSSTLLPPDPTFEEDQCRLYYYSFSLMTPTPTITHQYALTAIPFEFPSLAPTRAMRPARYIYGCTTTTSSFGAALGRAVKIDALVKVDALALIERAQRSPPRSVSGCVDQRSVQQIMASADPAADAVQVFKMPAGWYAQEPRFVPRRPRPSSPPSPSASGEAEGEQHQEDDGFLLTYAFDESDRRNVHPHDGECAASAASELWIVDARRLWAGSAAVLARVTLPQRVPYGLHGNWFAEAEVRGQREIERVRTLVGIEGGDGDRDRDGGGGGHGRRDAEGGKNKGGRGTEGTALEKLGGRVRAVVERALG